MRHVKYKPWSAMCSSRGERYDAPYFERNNESWIGDLQTGK